MGIFKLFLSCVRRSVYISNLQTSAGEYVWGLPWCVITQCIYLYYLKKIQAFHDVFQSINHHYNNNFITIGIEQALIKPKQERGENRRCGRKAEVGSFLLLTHLPASFLFLLTPYTSKLRTACCAHSPVDSLDVSRHTKPHKALHSSLHALSHAVIHGCPPPRCRLPSRPSPARCPPTPTSCCLCPRKLGPPRTCCTSSRSRMLRRGGRVRGSRASSGRTRLRTS